MVSTPHNYLKAVSLGRFHLGESTWKAHFAIRERGGALQTQSSEEGKQRPHRLNELLQWCQNSWMDECLWLLYAEFKSCQEQTSNSPLSHSFSSPRRSGFRASGSRPAFAALWSCRWEPPLLGAVPGHQRPSPGTALRAGKGE